MEYWQENVLSSTVGKGVLVEWQPGRTYLFYLAQMEVGIVGEVRNRKRYNEPGGKCYEKNSQYPIGVLMVLHMGEKGYLV